MTMTRLRQIILVAIVLAGCATVRPIVPESPGRTEAPTSCWEAGKTKQSRPEDTAGCRVQAWLGELISGIHWDRNGEGWGPLAGEWIRTR